MYKKLIILAMAVMTASATFAAEGAEKVKRSVKFDRGLNVPSATFVQKGLWTTGIKASYADYNMSDYQFLVIDNIGLDGYGLDLSAHVGYTFRDNMMVGARFGYDRTIAGVSSANLGVADVAMEISNMSIQKHAYTGMLFYRYYMGLGQSKRFAFFTEVQLGVGGSQSKQYLGSNNGMYEKALDLSVGFTPGVSAFITNNLALEVSVNVLGFNYKCAEQTQDQVTVGRRTSSSLDYKINLMSVGIGISFYL